jgi:hypothetical protein
VLASGFVVAALAVASWRAARVLRTRPSPRHQVTQVSTQTPAHRRARPGPGRDR